MLFGLFLAATPIIIHLLNRRRFIVLDWAPMKYLKLTIRTNKRRVQIEQLLLLLLRTLLIILLVFVIARPALSKAGLGSWLAKRSRVSRVIVIDTSLPMGYRTDGKTALDRAKAAVAEIIRNTGSQDSVTILTTTPLSKPIVKEAAADDPNKLVADMNQIQTTDVAPEWSASFKSIDEALSTATFPQKQLVLVTDLRRTGWSADVTPLADKWAKAGIEARIVDVGSRSTADVALLRFAQEDPVAVPGKQVRLVASVRNDTPNAIEHGTAELTVDGQTRPLDLPPLPAGATTDVRLSVTTDRPGQHVAKLKLADDALAADNQRTIVINDRERVDMTLVDGRISPNPLESAGDFLQTALAVGDVPWHVTRIGDGDPQAAKPVPADVTAFVDLATIPPGAVEQYEKLVRDGMGLMVFVGDQTDLPSWNDRLFRGGAGLLPARLDHVVDAPVKGIVVEGFADSPMAAVAQLSTAALSRVTTRKLMAVELPAALPPDVRVLAKWNDPEGHPAVIEKRFGRGRVVLFTTSADPEWTEWPKDPTYVLTALSTAAAVARPDAEDDNLSAGHPIRFTPADGAAFTRPRVTSPDASTPQPMPAGASMVDTQTQTAGTYTLSWADATGHEQTHQVAVSYDRAAADLEPISEDQLARLLGSLKADVVPYVPQQLATAGGGREIWRNLAITLGLLMLVETLFAFYVGRER
jgi:hypothetical protein